MPPLLQWFPRYIMPSIVAIVVTYLMLYLTQRKALKQNIETNISVPILSQGGKTAIVGIAITAVILLVASALNIQLGLPTAITGVFTSAIVIVRARKNPWAIVKGVSWSVLPLVGGLFVLVEALNKTGITQMLNFLLHQSAQNAVNQTVWGSGIIIAFACNLMNNLPVGLITGSVMQGDHIN